MLLKVNIHAKYYYGSLNVTLRVVISIVFLKSPVVRSTSWPMAVGLAGGGYLYISYHSLGR